MPIKTLKNSDGTPAGYRIEAETCDYVWIKTQWANTPVETNKANASGTQCLGSLNTTGNTMTFTFKAASAGKGTIVMWLASNANSGRGDTTFNSNIFTVTCNGVNVPFEPQTVHGGSTYSDLFEAVTLSEVDIKKGNNVIVVTVGSTAASMGNFDCIDILTSVSCTSADGSAPAGEATLPAPAAPETGMVASKEY